MTSLSPTAFMFGNELVDTVMLAWEARNCGGAANHRKSTAVTTLALVAELLHRGMDIDSSDVQQALQKLK